MGRFRTHEERAIRAGNCGRVERFDVPFDRIVEVDDARDEPHLRVLIDAKHRVQLQVVEQPGENHVGPLERVRLGANELFGPEHEPGHEIDEREMRRLRMARAGVVAHHVHRGHLAGGVFVEAGRVVGEERDVRDLGRGGDGGDVVRVALDDGHVRRVIGEEARKGDDGAAGGGEDDAAHGRRGLGGGQDGLDAVHGGRDQAAGP